MSKLKIEAARRQLGQALAFFLQDRDPVAVHCLAGGGCELIEYYATKAGGQPFTSFMLKTTAIGADLAMSCRTLSAEIGLPLDLSCRAREGADTKFSPKSVFSPNVSASPPKADMCSAARNVR